MRNVRSLLQRMSLPRGVAPGPRTSGGKQLLAGWPPSRPLCAGRGHAPSASSYSALKSVMTQARGVVTAGFAAAARASPAQHAASASACARPAQGDPPLLRRGFAAVAARSMASEDTAATVAAQAAGSGAGDGGGDGGSAGDAAGAAAAAATAAHAAAGSAGGDAGASASAGSGAASNGSGGGSTEGGAAASSSSDGASTASGSDTASGSSGAASSGGSSGGGAAPGANGGSSGGGAGPPGAAAPPALVLSTGASMLPHPEKAHRGGEDAFMVTDPPLALGVADGVGGWAEIGVDAGAYARLLMAHAREEAEAMISARPEGGLAPQAVLERAYYRTNVQGSATACVLALEGTTLRASNVGDSGFVVVRGGAAAFQSPQQQHAFNFPFQLGSADGGASDHPNSAMRFELALLPGDIIITGTDGLWDNVFAEEAAAIASRCRAQGDSPEDAAHALCRYARMRATDSKVNSPFAYSALQAGYVYSGGKLDDITVLVTYVTQPSRL